MHYTWRKRDKTLSHINLTNCNGTISIILVGLAICWLVIYFNHKLLYSYYVTKIAVKAENAIVYISMLANTVWDLSHYHLCLLYCTCILPIITYTSAILSQIRYLLVVILELNSVSEVQYKEVMIIDDKQYQQQ